MKIFQTQSQFSPINITIESHAELVWLLTCLNTSETQATYNASNLELSLEFNTSKVQMEMFSKVKDIYDNQ